MFWNNKKIAEEAEESDKPVPVQKAVGPAKDDSSFLARSINMLLAIIEARLDYYFGRADRFRQPDFEIQDDGSPLARFVIDSKITVEEYIVLILALAPHIQADVFTPTIRKYLPKGGDFPEFGGPIRTMRGPCGVTRSPGP